jgi:hypothetical protein
MILGRHLRSNSVGECLDEVRSILEARLLETGLQVQIEISDAAFRGKAHIS